VLSTATTRQAAELSEEEIDRLVAVVFDTPALPFDARPREIPCAIRQECSCGRVVTIPLIGRGPEITREWVCPICGLDDCEGADQEPCTGRG
jgi:hypothetical protein